MGRFEFLLDLESEDSEENPREVPQQEECVEPSLDESEPILTIRSRGREVFTFSAPEPDIVISDRVRRALGILTVCRRLDNMENIVYQNPFPTETLWLKVSGVTLFWIGIYAAGWMYYIALIAGLLATLVSVIVCGYLFVTDMKELISQKFRLLINMLGRIPSR